MLQMMNNPFDWLRSIVYMLPGLIIGFTVHEFCHAAVAVKLGDSTPRLEGRMTLNPMAHIDWLGIVLFIFLGWGYARPVRTVPSNYKNRKWGSFFVSLAGPASNFFVAALLFGINTLLPVGIWSSFIYSGLSVNLTLCFLNLLPVPPLDGFHMLSALLPFKNYRVLYALERYGILILLVLSFLGVLGTYLAVTSGYAMMLFSMIFPGMG